MLDRVNDFFNHSSCGCVDPLFCTTTGESCEQRLLTPDSFLPCTFVADVVAHREEK